MRTFAITLLLVAAAGGCTQTNIAGPVAGGGGAILFASNREDNNYQLYRVSGDGARVTRLTADRTHNDLAPVASHDGRLIAWQREVAGPPGTVSPIEIWVMAADGSGARVVVSNGSVNETPSWTKDDRALVYASRVTGNYEIFRVTLDGSAPVNLTQSPYADQFPRVSPDGTKVLFQSNRELSFGLYVMGVDGSGVTRLTPPGGDNRFPAWTPDGRAIVWSRFNDGSKRFDLWRMDADGQRAHALLSTPFSETNASVSPDGRSIVFQSDATPPSALFVVPFEGGAMRQLKAASMAKPGADRDPAWGPA